MSNYDIEFKRFFEAMAKEMERHYEEQGNSWKHDYTRATFYPTHADYNEGVGISRDIPVGEILKRKLFSCVAKYKASQDTDELIDIANFCAMLWLRGEKKE
jgi:hypothetical protein